MFSKLRTKDSKWDRGNAEANLLTQWLQLEPRFTVV